MSFFNSELVRAEMSEISILQENIYKNIFEFPNMSKKEKLFHICLLEKLLDKQQVLYTRLKFSDDPEAIKMKERIKDSAQMMGLPSDVDMNVVFNNMSELLEIMKKHIDKTSSEL